MVDLEIEKKNEVFLRVKAEPHIYQELSDHFTFEVPGANFMPQYRNKYWDGKIRLFSNATGEIYVGLLDKIASFCKNYGYEYKFINNKYFGSPFEVNQMISMEGVKDYMTSICNHAPREYQIEGVYDALRHNRRLLISPTASGKSLMIYSLSRYYEEQGKRILIVVPTTSLVEQMTKDFADYGWDSEKYCHRIYSGREKEDDRPITITTWQSIYKLSRKWFEKYEVVIGDEAHLFKSKSLVQIMTKLHTAKYRFGFTGTLDGTQTHKWVLEGLFGPSYKIIRTDELIEKKYISKLRAYVDNDPRVQRIRKALAELTNFEGDTENPKEFMDYVLNNVRADHEDQTLTFIDAKGEEIVIGQDDHRLAGRGEKMAGKFGDDLAKKLKKLAK